MKATGVALSLKQPWATLVAHGLKSIEVRRWATQRRGKILIHAAKVSDPRPEAWRWVPRELQAASQLTGGVVGAAEITGCVPYSNPLSFSADRFLHFNDPSWYQPPMFGFLLAHAKPVKFRPAIGNIKFFEVGPAQ